jgi:hypothetical protein
VSSSVDNSSVTMTGVLGIAFGLTPSSNVSEQSSFLSGAASLLPIPPSSTDTSYWTSSDATHSGVDRLRLPLRLRKPARTRIDRRPGSPYVRRVQPVERDNHLRYGVS